MDAYFPPELPRIPRPSRQEARSATQVAMESFVQAMDGRLAMTPAYKKGEKSRVIRARLIGPKGEQRYRITVTGHNKGFVVRARPR